MKCQILFSGQNKRITDNLHEMSKLFSGKNKKNIPLSSAELSQRVIKVNYCPTKTHVMSTH